MIRKLMLLMENIQTGLNRTFLLFLLVFILAGCWSKDYDYIYQMDFENKTSDKVLLILGIDSADYGLDSIWMEPDCDSLWWSIRSDKNEDVRKKIFEGGYAPFEEQARVFRNDTLLVTWNGPAEEKGDTIHDFYNYSSWEIEMIDDDEGIVRFTIKESDFN